MKIKGILLDIDGTLMTGLEPITGASQSLKYLRENHIPYRFVSNGTRKSRINVLKKLEKLQIPIALTEICTPASAAIEYLQKKNIRACNLLITEDLMNDFIEGGITHDPASSFVIVGDAGERFTYDTMNSAFRSLLSGGELIALEKDKYWKDTDGMSLSAGPFVKGLEYATGCEAVIIGKPSSLFFKSVQDAFSGEGRCLMIGDDIMTDVKGAQDAGLIGIITLTGKFSPDEIDFCKVKSDGILSSISDLPDLLMTGDFSF
jgi:HAD superfamily hydrolase (TIGR01458 family)